VLVLGIDPGLTACGYGLLEADGRYVRALAWGCWRTEPAAPLASRLRQLFVSASELLAGSRPEAVALEESFVGADARMALAVGQVRGALLVAAGRAEVSCVEYAPATVKQAVCGYGRAEKRQVQLVAKALLRLEAVPTPTHAADALAVAYCHATMPVALQLAS
jgi:crossover junction endodeoxyribonuclease RuvC